MSWAHYLLQVNIYLVIFYCFYKLLLDKETYFVLNRLYLVSSGIFSLAIPFLRFELFSEKVVSDKLYISVNELNSVVTNYAVLPQTQEQYDWGRLIVIIYLLGVLLYFLHFAYQISAVSKLFNNANTNDAFSFFNKKSVAQHLPERATVDLHEDIHIKQLHTVDVIFFEILGIITWFNPIIYLYKKSIKNIHEYLADEAAAKFQGDKEAYAMLLLSQAFGIRPTSLTNDFFTKSLIKKRIFMLHKQRSKKVAVLKYGLFVPLFALTLILSSATIRKNDKILAVADIIPINSAKDFVNQVIQAPMTVVDLVSPPPPAEDQLITSQTMIMGDPTPINATTDNAMFEDFYQHLAGNIKYPTAASDNNLQGNTIINFTVRNGKILDIATQQELGGNCDEEVIKSVANFENKTIKDGKYSLKVSFKLEESDSQFKNANIVANENTQELSNVIIMGYIKKEKFTAEQKVIDLVNALPSVTINDKNEIEPTENRAYSFVTASTPPAFPGGMDKLYEFIGKSIKYPAAAADNEVQGSVSLSFIVEKDGSLGSFSVDKRLGYGIEEEAIRVMKSSKRWQPATQNGRPVRVKYSVPIKFSLDGKPKQSKASIVASIRLKSFSDGSKQPLYILDGELKESNIIQELDPKKIESINVLKDASATNLYGKKAEFGAVLITSKKPEKPRVSATIFK